MDGPGTASPGRPPRLLPATLAALSAAAALLLPGAVSAASSDVSAPATPAVTACDLDSLQRAAAALLQPLELREVHRRGGATVLVVGGGRPGVLATVALWVQDAGFGSAAANPRLDAAERATLAAAIPRLLDAPDVAGVVRCVADGAPAAPPTEAGPANAALADAELRRLEVALHAPEAPPPPPDGPAFEVTPPDLWGSGAVVSLTALVLGWLLVLALAWGGPRRPGAPASVLAAPRAALSGRALALALVLATLALALAVAHALVRPVDPDEVNTFSYGWLDPLAHLAWEGSADPYYPPGGMLISAAWIRLGHCLLWGRALGFLALAPAILLFAAAGRRLLGPRAGIGFAAFLAGSGLLYVTASEARPYGLITLACAWTLAALARSWDGPQPAPRAAAHVGAAALFATWISYHCWPLAALSPLAARLSLRDRAAVALVVAPSMLARLPAVAFGLGRHGSVEAALDLPDLPAILHATLLALGGAGPDAAPDTASALLQVAAIAASLLTLTGLALLARDAIRPTAARPGPPAWVALALGAALIAPALIIGSVGQGLRAKYLLPVVIGLALPLSLAVARLTAARPPRPAARWLRLGGWAAAALVGASLLGQAAGPIRSSPLLAAPVRAWAADATLLAVVPSGFMPPDALVASGLPPFAGRQDRLAPACTEEPLPGLACVAFDRPSGGPLHVVTRDALDPPLLATVSAAPVALVIAHPVDGSPAPNDLLRGLPDGRCEVRIDTREVWLAVCRQPAAP